MLGTGSCALVLTRAPGAHTLKAASAPIQTLCASTLPTSCQNGHPHLLKCAIPLLHHNMDPPVRSRRTVNPERLIWWPRSTDANSPKRVFVADIRYDTGIQATCITASCVTAPPSGLEPSVYRDIQSSCADTPPAGSGLRTVGSSLVTTCTRSAAYPRMRVCTLQAHSALIICTCALRRNAAPGKPHQQRTSSRGRTPQGTGNSCVSCNQPSQIAVAAQVRMRSFGRTSAPPILGRPLPCLVACAS